MIVGRNKRNNERVVLGGNGVTITGTVEAANAMQISSNIAGDVHSDSEVFVYDGAIINGNVNAYSVVVENGVINGSVHAKNAVHIAKNGIVSGNICCAVLSIDEGGCLQGECDMRSAESEEFETDLELYTV